MKKLTSWLLVSALVLSTSSVFAWVEQIPVTQPADASVEKIAPYYGNSAIKYSYDEKKLEELYNKPSSLIEVSCQSDDVFKNLGINSSSIKINTIGFSKNDLDISVDAKNCSFYANRSVWKQPSQGTTDEKALAAAQSFVDEIFGTKGIISVPTLGKPYITYRDNGGYYPMPMLEKADTVKTDSGLSSVPLVSSTGTTEKIDVQYNTITIVYPYVVGGTPVYNNYGGGKMGISITVDGNGVSSVNVPLLAFKGIAKTAEKNTLNGLKKFVAQGGNNPYYGSNGNATTVKLSSPERVLVYFNYYAPNTSTQRNFISDGIRFGSAMRQDMYSQNNYEMVISDFIIGNNNNALLMDDSAIVSSPTPTAVKKTITLPKKKIWLKKPLISIMK